MTRRLAFVLIVLALLPGLANAVAPDEPNDAEDLLYFAKDRLIVIRLHIRVDGKSFETVWNEYIDKLLRDLDKDGDGVLSGKEAAPLPTRNQLAQAGLIRRDRFASGRTPSADRSPRDGKVTRQELAGYIRNLGMGPFSTQINQRSQARPSPIAFSNRRGPQGNELFGHLDVNQDGKLSKDEFAAASRTLHKSDLDDDETISLAELQPVQNPYYFAVEASQQQPANQQPFFTTLSAAESPSKLLNQLLERYDRAGGTPTPDGKLTKDNNLSREEIGLDQKSFQQFDADGNGLLDFDELMQFVRKPPPAIEVIVRIGKRKPAEQLVEIVKSNTDLAANVRKSAGGLVTIVLGKVQLEIGADTSSFRVQNDVYKAQFKAADTDNNKYLEFKEVERNPYFRNMYYLMDRDSDGKVFEEEMLAYIEQQTAAARSRTILNVGDQGRNLFEILDLNRDRRLGKRELKAAVERMELWDADGDSQVAESELPTHFRLTLTRGRPGLFGGGIFQATSAARYGSAVAGRTSSGGPIWFRKMDRNRDGDVSRREFLGSRRAFQKLDANNDEFIDAAESLTAK